jgi:hypothetical protein
MPQDLKALFESAVLNDETKQALQEAFDAAVLVKSTELEADYITKLAESQKELTDTALAMVEEAVADQMKSIAEEVTHARTLEVQYADKLEQFKESYAQKVDETVNVLVAEAVAEEIEELKESIEEAKKIKFVTSMFESFKETYEQLFGGVEPQTVAELKEAKAELDTMKRKAKMEEVLESLTGQKRKVAETILEGVALDKIEARFEAIKPLLLAESKESKQEQIDEAAKAEENKEIQGTVVLENVEDENNNNTNVLSEAVKARLDRSIQAALKR